MKKVKKREVVSPIRERLILMDQDNATCDVLPVRDIGNERILAGNGDYSVPVKDAKQFISPQGRVFIVNAPDWYVKEAKHLAEVEQATIIAQAVNYQKPGTVAAKSGGFMTFLPWILAVLAVVFALLKK